MVCEKICDNFNCNTKEFASIFKSVNRKIVILVLKAAIGDVFYDLIKNDNYTFYGFMDFDMVLSNLEILFGSYREYFTQYDCITFSDNDDERLFLRGQLTLFKNIEKYRKLWLTNPYVTTYAEFISNMRMRSPLYLRITEEGGFSDTIYKRQDINWIVLPGQLKDDVLNEFLYDNGIVYKCVKSNFSFNGNLTYCNNSLVKRNFKPGKIIVKEIRPADSYEGTCSFWVPFPMTCFHLHSSRERGTKSYFSQTDGKQFEHIIVSPFITNAEYGIFFHLGRCKSEIPPRFTDNKFIFQKPTWEKCVMKNITTTA